VTIKHLVAIRHQGHHLHRLDPLAPTHPA
jgi:hypothetical protein